MKSVKSIVEHDACHSLVTYTDGTIECLPNNKLPKIAKPKKKSLKDKKEK